MQIREAELTPTVLDAVRQQVPVKDLPGVRIAKVRQEPERPFDLSFELTSGKNRILVFGEIKQPPSPKMLAEIGPWIQRMKSLKADAAFAIVAPALSPQAQAYCVANGIDFLDLAGNISIQVPGKFTLQRLGRRSPERNQPSDSSRSMNVFSGRSSRVLRVLSLFTRSIDATRAVIAWSAEMILWRPLQAHTVVLTISCGMTVPTGVGQSTSDGLTTMFPNSRQR